MCLYFNVNVFNLTQRLTNIAKQRSIHCQFNVVLVHQQMFICSTLFVLCYLFIIDLEASLQRLGFGGVLFIARSRRFPRGSGRRRRVPVREHLPESAPLPPTDMDDLGSGHGLLCPFYLACCVLHTDIYQDIAKSVSTQQCQIPPTERKDLPTKHAL